MGTVTPRAGLYKPDENGEVVDVAKINTNSDIIDNLIKGEAVTSTTMPTDPVEGQVVYVTDTKQQRMYVGGTAGMNGWVWIGGLRPAGSITKTDLFQAIPGTTSATPTQIKMVGGGVEGGVTIDTTDASGARIKIGEDGLYQITNHFYCTGGTGLVSVMLRIDKPDGTFLSYFETHKMEKTGASDIAGARTSSIRLSKGNMVRQAAYCGVAGPQSWGKGGEWASCSVEVTYLGTLV